MLATFILAHNFFEHVLTLSLSEIHVDPTKEYITIKWSDSCVFHLIRMLLAYSSHKQTILKHWNYMWLETNYSSLVLQSFQESSNILSFFFFVLVSLGVLPPSCYILVRVIFEFLLCFFLLCSNIVLLLP